MKTVIAILEVDDDRTIAEDMSTIEYLEREMGWVADSGIYLQNARILDNDTSPVPLSVVSTLSTLSLSISGVRGTFSNITLLLI